MSGSEYTEYDGFAVEYRDASHRYWIVEGTDRRPAISVTRALKVLDKPALISWAERVGVEGALRLERSEGLTYPDGGSVPISEAIYVVRSTGNGADAKRDAGALRGTAIHDALRTYYELGTVPNVGDFPEEVRGYVQAVCLWLLKADPEPVEVERVIGSPTRNYAGRLDLIANIEGRKVLVDFKTNPAGRIYDEAHLQAAAYLHALPACGIGDVERAILVSFGEDGGFEELAGEADAEDFLSILDSCRRVSRLRSARQARERAFKKEREAQPA